MLSGPVSDIARNFGIASHRSKDVGQIEKFISR